MTRQASDSALHRYLTLTLDFSVQLDKALSVLERNCSTNDLIVNINNTKVLITSRCKLSNETPKFFNKN